jgi:2,6-dihydroxypseudooxynicotine hydrolase
MSVTTRKVEAILNPGRMLADGIPYPDFAAARALDDLGQWFPFWADTGKRYEELGEAALAAGDKVSAGEWLWQASLSWHYAQFMWFHEPELREQGQREKVRLYRRAAPFLVLPAERVDIPFDGVTIPGYLRLAAVAGPQACAILLGGLESTKEESYLFEAVCHRRGMATFSFDGPGQGELFFERTLQPDFERYTSAVLDTLAERPEIDSGRLGVLGRSLGGLYAMRSAARDKRLKACVAWGAFMDMRNFDGMPGHTQDGFAYVSGFSDRAEGKEYLLMALDLSDAIGDLDCPTYVLQGVHDPIFPPSQTELIRDAVAGKPAVELVVEPAGDHCCHNMANTVRPRMADWLARQLRG